MNWVDSSGHLRSDTITRLIGLQSFEQVIARARINGSFGLLKALQDARVGDTLKMSGGGYLNILPPGEGFASLVPGDGGVEWKVLCAQGKVNAMPGRLRELPGSLPGGFLMNNIFPQRSVGPVYAINDKGPMPGVPGYLNKDRNLFEPDFVQASISKDLFSPPLKGLMPPLSPSIAGGGGITIDRYGNFYWTLGGAAGLGTLPVSTKIAYGYYVLSWDGEPLLRTPDEATLKSHLTGFGVTGETSHPILWMIGLSESFSGEGFSGEVSLHEPSIGISGGYSGHFWQMKETSWHWVDDKHPGFGESDIRLDDPPGNECSSECSQPGNFRYLPLQ